MKDVWISTQKEHMNEKYYQPLGIVLAESIKIYNEETDQYEVKVNDLKKAVQQITGWTLYKWKKFFSVMIDTGLFIYNKDKTAVSLSAAMKGNNAIMSFDLAEFCVNHLSYETFKVYCFLLCKFQQGKFYAKIRGGNPKFEFSIKDIIEMCGYQYKTDKVKQYEQALVVLKKIGLIDYSTQEGSDLPLSVPKKNDEGQWCGSYITLNNVVEHLEVLDEIKEDVRKELTFTEEKVINEFGIEEIFLFKDGVPVAYEDYPDRKGYFVLPDKSALDGKGSRYIKENE